MPVYQYECDNPGCTIDNKPFEFEKHLPLSKYKEIPACPKCNNAEYVKKVIRSAFPVSESWRVG
jgi:predicted nucleic acid-binding Zn ribbon protein